MSDNMDEPVRPENLVSYHSKIVGVTFEGRQAVLSVLKGSEPLRVRREPENEYDPNAVAVDAYINKEWLPVGYIAKDKNSDIAATLDAKGEVFIKIGSVTGGGSKSFGLNIYLEYTKEVAPKAAEAEESTAEKIVVSKKEATNVLKYLLDVVSASGKEDKTTDLVRYSSKLIGKTIELREVNGHRRLEGYLSGSKFPDQFYQPFDREGILKAIADKYDVDPDKVEAMWGLNNSASTGYGTAIHAAMENYDRNQALGDKIKSVKTFKTKPDEIGPNKALSKNPFIKHIVESFHEQFGGKEPIFTEEFIWDEGFKLCGSVDRIKVVDLGKRVIRIQDYKTDGDIHDKKYQLKDSPFKSKLGNELLDLHWLQLSFYAFILGRAGWKVEGLDIFWLNPGKLVKGENPWEIFSHEVLDISEAIING